MIRQVVTAYPGAVEGEDRLWSVLLDCGHETQVRGRTGRHPKKGASAVCSACEENEKVAATLAAMPE